MRYSYEFKRKCVELYRQNVAADAFKEMYVNAKESDVDHGLVFCGANAYRIDKITTVHDLIQELTQD